MENILTGKRSHIAVLDDNDSPIIGMKSKKSKKKTYLTEGTRVKVRSTKFDGKKGPTLTTNPHGYMERW